MAVTTPVLAYLRTAMGGRYAVAQFVHWEGGGTDWTMPVERGVIKISPPKAWQPLPPPPSSKEAKEALG